MRLPATTSAASKPHVGAADKAAPSWTSGGVSQCRLHMLCLLECQEAPKLLTWADCLQQSLHSKAAMHRPRVPQAQGRAAPCT